MPNPDRRRRGVLGRRRYRRRRRPRLDHRLEHLQAPFHDGRETFAWGHRAEDVVALEDDFHGEARIAIVHEVVHQRPDAARDLAGEGGAVSEVLGGGAEGGVGPSELGDARDGGGEETGGEGVRLVRIFARARGAILLLRWVRLGGVLGGGVGGEAARRREVRAASGASRDAARSERRDVSRDRRRGVVARGGDARGRGSRDSRERPAKAPREGRCSAHPARRWCLTTSARVSTGSRSFTWPRRRRRRA